jgi:hypothetical protein
MDEISTTDTPAPVTSDHHHTELPGAVLPGATPNGQIATRCADCGLREAKISLCDRWRCPHLRPNVVAFCRHAGPARQQGITTEAAVPPVPKTTHAPAGDDADLTAGEIYALDGLGFDYAAFSPAQIRQLLRRFGRPGRRADDDTIW